MLSGKGQIEPADPPADLEPNAPPAIDLPKSDEEAEEQPEEEEDEGGLKEHGLRLGEFLDGIQGDDGGEEGGEVGVNAGADLPVVEAGVEEGAAAAGDEVVPWPAGAQAAVVSE